VVTLNPQCKTTKYQDILNIKNHGTIEFLIDCTILHENFILKSNIEFTCDYEMKYSLIKYLNLSNMMDNEQNMTQNNEINNLISTVENIFIADKNSTTKYTFDTDTLIQKLNRIQQMSDKQTELINNNNIIIITIILLLLIFYYCHVKGHFKTLYLKYKPNKISTITEIEVITPKMSEITAPNVKQSVKNKRADK
jgi:flagellar biosynthesis regulator FlbT